MGVDQNEHIANPTDHRVVRENGTAARVAAVIEPAIIGLGYRLVRVRITGQNGCTLQVMAERPDGTFSIQDCEAVSVDISPLLDVEDIIKTAYHLEVSSPGVDRPLVRPQDFDRAKGHIAKVEFSLAVEDSAGESRRRFRGSIGAVHADSVELISDEAGKASSITVPFDAIDDAKLIMTDALFEAARIQQNSEATSPHQAAVNDNGSDAEN
ncbi:MAG: ribosome maturation factor RimP [Pseudomonadota bacterium]